MEAKQPADMSQFISGSEILVAVLRNQQVDFLFGYPGGAVLPIFDSFYTTGFKNILPRHEQGAVHAAEGFAKATGKTGVVCVTSGPGVANTVTGIADAMMDSVPIVVLSGQVATKAIGTNAFQELDVVNITRPITKKSFQVHHIEELAATLNEAFALAQSGRKGPVLVDLPKNIMSQKMTEMPLIDFPATDFINEDSQREIQSQSSQLADVAAALEQASKPVFLVGNGIMAAGATALAREFVRRYSIPVVSTLLGLGIIPEDNPMFLGMGGMHGNYAANMALHESDFILNIGSRFDDRLVPNTKKFAPHAKIAHIDIDPHELGKVIRVDYPVIADAKAALQELLKQHLSVHVNPNWLQLMASRKQNQPYHYHKDPDILKPQEVIQAVGKATHGDALVITDVGQHQMWAAQFYPFKHPNQLITSGGLGTMGFGIPAAIGARFANPTRDVVLFVGDGGFQMTSEELEVMGANHLNIKIFLLNNKTLGMVRQWQDGFYNHHHADTMFTHQPDFKELVHAYDVDYVKLSKQDDLMTTLTNVFTSDHPTLVDVTIPSFEQVYPMIAPGHGNNEMMGLTD